MSHPLGTPVGLRYLQCLLLGLRREAEGGKCSRSSSQEIKHYLRKYSATCCSLSLWGKHLAACNASQCSCHLYCGEKAFSKLVSAIVVSRLRASHFRLTGATTIKHRECQASKWGSCDEGHSLWRPAPQELDPRCTNKVARAGALPNLHLPTSARVRK